MTLDWTAIAEFESGQLVNETDLNHIVDNLEYLKAIHNYAELQPHTEINSSVASISMDSIPGDFAALRLQLGLRTDAASVSDHILMEFNNDTAASNYASYFADRYGVSSGAPLHRAWEYLSGSNAGIRLHYAAGATAQTGRLAIVDLTIFNYASEAQQRLVIYQSTWGDQMNITGKFLVGAGGGIWNQTSPITRIDLTPITGNNFTLGFYNLMGVGS